MRKQHQVFLLPACRHTEKPFSSAAHSKNAKYLTSGIMTPERVLIIGESQALNHITNGRGRTKDSRIDSLVLSIFKCAGVTEEAST